jgi:uncharacterized membrane protein
MSDRASGLPGHSRFAARAALLATVLGLVAGPVAPIALAADGPSVTTPFPSIVAEPGNTASFALTLAVATDGDVNLKADNVPSGWTARFTGGGSTIDAAYVTKDKAVGVTLNVEIPAEATPGSSTIRVQASGPGGSSTLPLTVRVADAAQGDVKLTSDYPELRGPAASTFSFNLTLRNGTAAEATFGIDAQGPDGWTVTAKPAGQAQATSTTVAANGTGSISVSVEAPDKVEAGTYPVKVAVSGGGKTAEADLNVIITGSYSLVVSTANQVLSTTANAGTATSLDLTIQNTGTAPVTNVAPSADTPTKWTVKFNPETVAAIAPGETAKVTAQITPTADAITGDYSVTMNAKGAEASGDVAIRVKVETPTYWMIAGIVLIVLIFAGLWWVFRTYGRR